MPSKSAYKPIGVVIMTYGSATTAAHVPAYFKRIFPAGVSHSLIDDFRERYRLVGRSPLIDITKKQASKTETLLNKTNQKYLVRAGMLHSKPFINDAVAELKSLGAARLIGIILSPQFSPLIMSKYPDALRSAAKTAGFKEPQVIVANSWATEPQFIEFLVSHTKEALKKLPQRTPVLFTTHSLPERVVKKDPSYLSQLNSTAKAIIEKLDSPNWYLAYQSAGHTPEAWLKPDIVDVLAVIKKRRPEVKDVLIVPLQFLADHLEILYDLDIAGRKQCKGFGFNYHRIPLPNTHPLFIEALASIVRKQAKEPKITALV